MIELLIVIAIIGIILTIGVFNGRQALNTQEETAALNSLRQSVWQGATAASARGEVTELVRSGDRLEVITSNGEILRSETLPAGVTSNLPQGTILVFTPPGKIDSATLPYPGQFSMSTGNRRVEIEFSAIGEVRIR